LPLRQGTPSKPLRLHHQAPALIIFEPKTPAPELLPEDRILVAQIFDCQLLLLVHPSRRRDQQKPERVKNLVCRQSALSQPFQ